jgi:hypothetical protein
MLFCLIWGSSNKLLYARGSGNTSLWTCERWKQEQFSQHKQVFNGDDNFQNEESKKWSTEQQWCLVWCLMFEMIVISLNWTYSIFAIHTILKKWSHFTNYSESSISFLLWSWLCALVFFSTHTTKQLIVSNDKSDSFSHEYVDLFCL